jgi:hypothetical protein
MIIFRRAQPPASSLSKIFLAVCMISLAALIVWVIPIAPNEPLDPATGCPKQRKVGHFVLILIDQSNQFEDADRERVRTMIDKILSSLDYADKLVAIEPNAVSAYQPTPLFERCSPKNPASVNALVDQVQSAQNATEAFKGAFWSRIEPALKRTDAQKSPLLETFSYIPRLPDFYDAERRSIHVYSDLIQYSDVANFYKKVPAVEEVDRLTEKANGLTAVPPNFRGAQVFLEQVARRDHWELRPQVDRFWDEWLRKHDGTPRWNP